MHAKDFFSYLYQRPRGEIVGIASSYTYNPMAVWLNSLSPADSEMLPWEVTPYSILFNGAWICDLNKWEQNFQTFVWYFPCNYEISREEALAWLEVACHGTQNIAA